MGLCPREGDGSLGSQHAPAEGAAGCFSSPRQLTVLTPGLDLISLLVSVTLSSPSICGVMVCAILLSIFVSTALVSEAVECQKWYCVHGTYVTCFVNKREFPFWWRAENFEWLLNRSPLNILLSLMDFLAALPPASFVRLF